MVNIFSLISLENRTEASETAKKLHFLSCGQQQHFYCCCCSCDSIEKVIQATHGIYFNHKHFSNISTLYQLFRFFHLLVRRTLDFNLVLILMRATKFAFFFFPSIKQCTLQQYRTLKTPFLWLRQKSFSHQVISRFFHIVRFSISFVVCASFVQLCSCSSV